MVRGTKNFPYDFIWQTDIVAVPCLSSDFGIRIYEWDFLTNGRTGSGPVVYVGTSWLFLFSTDRFRNEIQVSWFHVRA
jgi:hypothetical protein